MNRLIIVSSTFLASCTSSVEQNKTDAESDFTFGITLPEDIHPSDSIVSATFSLINETDDPAFVNDSVIQVKPGEKAYTYRILSASNLISENGDSLRTANILIAGLTHSSDKELKTLVLRQLANHLGLFEINLYTNEAAYLEQLKSDAPASADEFNRKARLIWNGLTGTLHHGNYYEYEIARH